jgi:hypothetical protein
LRKAVIKPRRAAFNSLCLLIARSIWLERNARVFNNQSRTTQALVQAITNLGEL